MQRNVIEQLSITAILQSVLEEVTQKQIDYEGSKMGAPQKGEERLNVSPSDLIKRMYCAGKFMNRKAKSQAAMAECAVDQNEEASLKADAYKTGQLSEILSEIMWYELRSESGVWGDGIGLRDGWTVVKKPIGQSGPGGAIAMEMPDFLRKLFGGQED